MNSDTMKASEAAMRAARNMIANGSNMRADDMTAIIDGEYAGLVEAARGVLLYDWSGCDHDAAMSVERLRAALARATPKEQR